MTFRSISNSFGKSFGSEAAVFGESALADFVLMRFLSLFVFPDHKPLL